MGFFSPDPGDQSEPRGDAWYPDRNPDVNDKASGCPMAIPRALWTVLKVSFNHIFRGIKPDYVT